MNMTTTRYVTALLAMVVTAGQASAGEIALFGVTLGAPFVLQECPKKELGGTTVYEQATAATCFERFGSQEQLRATSPIATDAVMIRFAAADVPVVMSGNTAIGLVIDGNLEGCTFNTRGIDAQAQVLEVLKQNFGEPGSYARKQAQNVLGETYESFDATWTKPDADVLFRSVTSRIDTGLLNVYTGKARQVRPRPVPGPAKTGL